MTGRFVNQVLSFIVFTLLDILDFLLCYVYKILDYLIEAEWKPCYCYSSAEEGITSGGKILVSEHGESKILHLTPTKLHLEEISDTLYNRPCLVSEVSKSLKRVKVRGINTSVLMHSREKINKGGGKIRSSYAIIEMLQSRIQRLPIPSPRWSDCDCKTCTCWISSCQESLFVKADGAKDNIQEDVLFIHGFISSSAFWTETLYPNFSRRTKSKYRLLAVDLLGFGKSPKPSHSLYTLREHLDMIDKYVLEAYKVESFHIVAHSLGCILALALAVRHPHCVKSLTLLAPPYFPSPNGESASQHMMRRLAPRRVWPLITFGASLACWYEHISRTASLVLCKNHRLWEFLAKLATGNRIRTYLMEGFLCHTHIAAWHTLHNIICGTAGIMERYLDEVKNVLKCDVNIFHGKDDELIPVECSYSVKSRIPRAKVKVVENTDHITIVVGRQKAFSRELEQIWRNAGAIKSD